MPLIKDNERELVFAHRPLSGFFIGVIGFGAIAALSHWRMIDSESVRLLVYGFLFLFGFLGVLGIFWRYRIEADLLSRTYRAERGFWPASKKWRGSFDEFNGVVLTVAVVKQDKGTRTVWTVSLDLKGLKKPASVFVTSNEHKAYQKLEHFSRKLRVKAADMTGKEAKETNWNELDRSIAERLVEAPERIGPPPAGSGIELHEDSSGTWIGLPAGGFSFGALFLFLFGLPFASFGLVVGWISIFSPEKVDGPLFLVPIFVLAFTGTGLIIMLAACYGVWGRETIIGLQDRVMNRGLMFGKYIGIKRSLLKKEIEEVTVKPVPSRRFSSRKQVERYELFVRSDNGTFHIGAGLPDDHLQWLKDAVSYLVVR